MVSFHEVQADAPGSLEQPVPMVDSPTLEPIGLPAAVRRAAPVSGAPSSPTDVDPEGSEGRQDVRARSIIRARGTPIKQLPPSPEIDRRP